MEFKKSNCKCKNITPQSQECYDQMTGLNPVGKMIGYIKRIQSKGLCLDGKIYVDPCIAVEIMRLWWRGIITYGCCCGHNVLHPYVNVDESNIDQMLELGYVQEHTDKTRKDTFRLKSVS